MHYRGQVPKNSDLSAAPLVCIVDDDSSMADSTRFLVRSFGFRAEAFLSAQQFLESGLVEDTKCLILILDLRMPGIDGLELQRNLVSAKKQIPIIFISARATEQEQRQAIAGGAVDFLRKPFSEEALLNAIQAALTRGRWSTAGTE
jgi:FixJ family two-component response regulator